MGFNRKLLVFLWMFLSLISFSSGQKIEIKEALVDFFKGLNQIPEIKIDPAVSSQFPVETIENPKPGRLYLGLKKDATGDYSKVSQIINSLINKDVATAFQLYDEIKDRIKSPILDKLIEGEKSLRNFEYEKAIKLFTDVIETNPENEFAYYERAKILNSLGRTKEAKKDFIMAIMLNPRFKFYYLRNKYLFKQLDIKLKNRWFVPSWKKEGDSYVVKNELWKYYAQAMLIFKDYSLLQLKEITGIANKDIALRVLAINIMLHYARLNNLMDDEMKKIEKIMQKNLLPGFVAIEIMPYFYDEFDPLDVIDIQNAKKYFEEYYLD